MATLIIPPYRAAILTNGDGSPMSLDDGTGATAPILTEKQWYLFWRQMADQVNAGGQAISSLAGLVTFGSHADRPDPQFATDGALYVEWDRGSVIYQNQGGVWVYIAGIMYGTLVPDQRPTDLTAPDAGFQFRTNVDPAQAFAWSGTEWIETTPIRYGTHAARLATPVGGLASGILWMETDRGSVIYQNQGGVWLYLAGTMWGTMVPDQRPTDLGATDAGFDFRSTDLPAREFIWSGTVWVETTPTGQTPWTSNIDGAGFALTNVGKIDSTGMIRTTGGVAPTSGVGLEISYQGGVCYLLGFNRTAGTYQQVTVLGSGISLGANGGLIQLVGGNVAIGSITPSFLLQLAADSAGKPGTSTWSVVSDVRLKQHIETVKDDSLAILNKLAWVRFEYNGKADTPRGENAIGLVAQMLQEQLPEAVRSNKAKLQETDDAEADVLSIDYHHVLVHSARAIVQLSAEVEALRALIGKPT